MDGLGHFHLSLQTGEDDLASGDVAEFGFDGIHVSLQVLNACGEGGAFDFALAELGRQGLLHREIAAARSHDVADLLVQLVLNHPDLVVDLLPGNGERGAVLGLDRESLSLEVDQVGT